MVQDESIFIRIGTNGRKLWSHVGDPVAVSRIGTNGRKLWSHVGDPVAVSRTDRRDKTIVYGALAEEETRLMRQYDRFDGLTFVKYLKEVRRKWGSVLLIVDNASQHKQGRCGNTWRNMTRWRSCTCLPRRRSLMLSSRYGGMQSTDLLLQSTTRRWRI